MRHIYAMLLLLIVLPSCHSRKKAMRRRQAAASAPARPARPAAAPAAHKTSKGPKKSAYDVSAETYIATYKNSAISQMRKYGIPASIILAQGMLESNNGNSELARNANNHFGIKCTKDWKGKTYTHAAEEGDCCFRRYASADASYKDHSEFLKRPHYAALFKLSPTDYKGWAHGLKNAGYATNPKYPQLLINMVEKYSLHKYD